MRKIILFFICIILQTFNADFCAAQNQPKIDSLLIVLKTAKEDTNKVKALNDLSQQLRGTGDFDSAKKYSGTALLLSEKLNFKPGKILAFNGLGIISREQGNYADALKNFNDALKIAEELGNKSKMAGIVVNMGLVYWNQGNYSQALNLYFKGLKIDEELNDTASIAIDYNNIGNIYAAQENYPDALKFYFLSVKYFQELHDDYSLATLYNNIGNIYIYQNNYAEALKNLLAALNNFEKAGDKKGVAMTYNNLGEVYYHEKNYSEALKNHLACLKIAEEFGVKPFIAASFRNIGAVYIAQGKFADAGKYLNNGIALAKEIGMKDMIRDAYSVRAKLDSAVGNYKEAFEDYKLYAVYNDSLFNETSSKQTAEMKTKYESEKQEKEIALLSKDKQIQKVEINRQKFIKTAFIIGLAVLLILSILFYNFYRTKQLLKLQTLRNRIASDLHDDVGSTLSSISIFSELAKEQSKEVIPMLESIGESSRKMLESMADIVWTINPENDNFEKIILRMRSFAYQLLGAKKIDFEFNADDTVTGIKLPMEVRKNLYLIFKEAINNIVKYADADNAFFSVSGTKNNLTMLIRDNGKGFDTTQTSEGNGLKNMKKRAEEVGAKLLIESGADIGTTIQFLLKIA